MCPMKTQGVSVPISYQFKMVPKFNNTTLLHLHKLEKSISIFSSNTFSNIKSTKTFLDSTQSKVSISKALVKTFHMYKQKKRLVERSTRPRVA